jgi:hypothetical protein
MPIYNANALYFENSHERNLQWEEEEEEAAPVFDYGTNYWFLNTFNLFKGMSITLEYDSTTPPPPGSPIGAVWFSSNLTLPEVKQLYDPFATALDNKLGTSLTVEMLFINVNSQTSIYQKLNFETDEYCKQKP